MACERMRELALLSIDGALDEAEQRELAEHLESCAGCRAAQAAARRVAAGLRQIQVPPVPLGFAERTQRRLESSASKRSASGIRRVGWVAAAAALILAAVMIRDRRARHEAPAPGFVASNRPEVPPLRRLDLLDEAGSRGKDAGAAAGEAGDESTAKDHEGGLAGASAKPGGGGGSRGGAGGRLVDGVAPEAPARQGEADAGAALEKAGPPKLGSPAGNLADKKSLRDGVHDAAEGAKRPDAAAPSAPPWTHDLRVGTLDDAMKRIGELARSSDAAAAAPSPTSAPPDANGEQKSEPKAKQEERSADRDDAAATRAESPYDLPALRFVVIPDGEKEFLARLKLPHVRDDDGNLLIEAPEPQIRTFERDLRRAHVRLLPTTERAWLDAVRRRAATPKTELVAKLAAADAPVSGGKAAPPAPPSGSPPPGAPKEAGVRRGAPSTGGSGPGDPSAPTKDRAPLILRVRWIVLFGKS